MLADSSRRDPSVAGPAASAGLLTPIVVHSHLLSEALQAVISARIAEELQDGRTRCYYL